MQSSLVSAGELVPGRFTGTKICRCSGPSGINAVVQRIPPPCHTCGLHVHGSNQLWSDSGLADPQMQNLQVWRQDSTRYSLGFSSLVCIEESH